MNQKQNLTLRYSATHFTFWAASTGAASFATTYLLGKDLPSGIVGALLAAAGLLSCFTQPYLAAIADKARKFVLIKMMVLLSAVCAACFCIQLIPQLPLLCVGIFYMIGIWSSDAVVPLLNAVSISYNQAGYKINYGVGRGFGSIASGVSSLVLGFIIARFGAPWMILILIAMRLLHIVVLLGYPKLEAVSSKRNTADTGKDTSCSIMEFFLRYKWYCVSLIGIMFMGMYLAMTENYMIAIMGRLGGNSSHVGTALFISCISSVPVIVCFQAIRKHIKDTSLLKIAACSFLLRAVLVYFAPNITTIYLIQLLQITSYAFLAPTQVFYAEAKVCSADMVKGQAFITAAYALGCSAGNFAGGQLLNLGVEAILKAGIVMALLGVIVIFVTVHKTDLFCSQNSVSGVS